VAGHFGCAAGCAYLPFCGPGFEAAAILYQRFAVVESYGKFSRNSDRTCDLGRGEFILDAVLSEDLKKSLALLEKIKK
jgi:hypothetical protein